MRFSSGAKVGPILGVVLLIGGAGSIPSSEAVAATRITRLEATLAGARVDVRGTATFADRPITVLRDGAGDPLLPDVGADLTAATISRPGSATTLRFALRVADLPSAGAGAAAAAYLWPISVDRGGRSESFTLMAWQSATQAPGSIEATYAVMSCAAAAVSTCEVVREVSGGIGNGAVSWDVPEAAIGTAPGGWIRNGTSPIRVDAGVDGRVDVRQVPLDSMDGAFAYRVGPWASVGIGRAGTLPGTVALSTPATVSTAGVLRASLPAPKAPGSYVVVAQVCGGLGNCATRTSRPFTITRPAPPSGPFDVVFQQRFAPGACPAGSPAGAGCLNVTGTGRSSRLGLLEFRRAAVFGGMGCPTTSGVLSVAGHQVRFVGSGTSCTGGTFVYRCRFVGGTGPYARANGTFTITVPPPNPPTEGWRGQLSL